MALRLQELDMICRKYGWSTGFDKDKIENYQRIIVDEKNKVLYCSIPKVACSSFKTFVLKAATGINNTHFHVNNKDQL